MAHDENHHQAEPVPGAEGRPGEEVRPAYGNAPPLIFPMYTEEETAKDYLKRILCGFHELDVSFVVPVVEQYETAIEAERAEADRRVLDGTTQAYDNGVKVGKGEATVRLVRGLFAFFDQTLPAVAADVSAEMWPQEMDAQLDEDEVGNAVKKVLKRAFDGPRIDRLLDDLESRARSLRDEAEEAQCAADSLRDEIPDEDDLAADIVQMLVDSPVIQNER